ncbi:MAG TPA: DNA alkylation repair protein [Candidatus Eisenbacteria bacterium]|nr:DNA alkylation repair protein [Candidatus Eisenbacteria bacterium]
MPTVEEQVQEAIGWLKSHATQAHRDGMARYAIPSDKALGVKMKDIQALAKRLGRSHELAAALWETDVYEARLLASYVDDPALVTPAQMDRWSREFGNWAVCDTACFVLFDRTPHAWSKVEQWAGRRDEYVKRGAFAMLASLTRHDKRSGDEPFIKGLVLVEREATDERNFVKKGVNWALRSIGKRNPALHSAAMEVARRLAASSDPAARWVGKDAIRDLAGKH